jgi:hypothetical protein
VGVGSRRKSPHPGQAQAVAAWLGTYELLINETRYLVGSRWEVNPSVLAQAATAVLARMDFDVPWIGNAKTGEGDER